MGCVGRKVPQREILLQHFPLSWNLYKHVEKGSPPTITTVHMQSGSLAEVQQPSFPSQWSNIAICELPAYSCLGSWLFGSRSGSPNKSLLSSWDIRRGEGRELGEVIFLPRRVGGGGD